MQSRNDSISALSASPCIEILLLDRHRQLARRNRPRALADEREDLLLQIDREIGVVLEDAQLALGLHAHAARRGIGDAAVREADARVGDVDLVREHRACRWRRWSRSGHRRCVCTMSMSWIMRSSTTFTSVPRSRYGASRWHSMKRGVLRYGSAARIAAIEALQVPDLQDQPVARARVSMSSRACAGVSVIGFSTSTCAPASRKSRAMAKCAGVVVATLTASTLPSSSR